MEQVYDSNKHSSLLPKSVDYTKKIVAIGPIESSLKFIFSTIRYWIISSVLWIGKENVLVVTYYPYNRLVGFCHNNLRPMF